MAVVHEDFIRCFCGNADFEEKVVVTLPKGLRTRYINERSVSHPALDKTIDYYCTKCNEKLTI
jgi:hypothetical protein